MKDIKNMEKRYDCEDIATVLCELSSGDGTVNNPYLVE